MFKNRIAKHKADSHAGAQPLEFEGRILAAIEQAGRAHKLPALSANAKRIIFLELQNLRKVCGFSGDSHRRWPDSPEKRQEAARWWLVHGEEGSQEPRQDRRTGEEISNERELHAVLYGSQNKPETIDRIGRDKTVQLLGEAFQIIADAFYPLWSNAPNPRYEVFSTWIETIRSIVIAACCAEWSGRRLAVTSPEAAEEEFGGPPPFWFDHLPLRAEAGLEGACAGATPARVAVWINQAREYELERRTAKTAGKTRPRKPAKRAKRRALNQPTAVLPEPAAAPLAQTPAESAVTAGEKSEEPASVAVEPPKDGPEAELQTWTEETVPVPATVRKSFPNRAREIKKLVESIKPKIKANANALYAASTVGEPDRRTWAKLLRGVYVRDDSINHAIAFFKRKGLLKLERTDIPND